MQRVVGTRWNQELHDWVCVYCGRPSSVIHIESAERFQSVNVDVCFCGEGSDFAETYKKVKCAVKPLSYYDYIINPKRES